MRRFEFENKFWQVHVSGPRVTMTWGEIGTTQPRVFDRGFATEAEAEIFAERQIIAQRERGYVETTPPREQVAKPEVVVERHLRFVWSSQFEEVSQEGTKLTVRGGKIANGRDVLDRDRLDVVNYATVHAASVGFDERCAQIRDRGGKAVDPEPTHATHSSADLEAQCEAAPDDPAPWAVYADWLIAQGDARGEIASLQQAGRVADAKRLLGIHLMDLAGTTAGKLVFDFRHGFATHADVEIDWHETDDLLEDVTRALLASPLGRFLDSLRFGLAADAEENDWAPTMHVVASSPRARAIRALQFDLFDDSYTSLVSHGDFRGLWQRLPALEVFVVRSASGQLGHMKLPKLHTLIRESSGLARSELADILASDLPALEYLELWFGSEDFGADCAAEDLRPILDGRFPTLRHLGIVNSGLVDAVLPELVRSAVLPQLRSLDLSKGALDASSANTLIANAGAFAHLEKIDVSSNRIAADAIDQLKQVLPSIVSTHQREEDAGVEYFDEAGE